jgi:hypothetical protein
MKESEQVKLGYLPQEVIVENREIDFRGTSLNLSSSYPYSSSVCHME